jgi:hypothetical protein
MIVTASLMALTWAAPGASAEKAITPQSRNYDSLNRLPDWSGVWVISDESFRLAIGDTVGVAPQSDNGRVPLQPKYLAIRNASASRKVGGAPGNLPKCLPAGMPGVLVHPMMTEYLFTPGRVTVLFEDGEVRRIYTDGRPHPPPNELEYGFSGHSIGHWEGATLVVDTIGISPRADMFSNNDVRVTRNTHIVERIKLKDPDTLQIDTVVTDAELFTKPYVYARTYQRTPLPVTDPSCSQSNRDNDIDVDLTVPPRQ